MDYKTEQIRNKLSEIESRINDSDNASLKSEFYDLKNLISSKLDNVKYGLVFETSEEKIEKLCNEKIPYLEKIENKTINKGANNRHILIEGDNYASLKLLLKTHRNKIDFIYIDPPYNTGNNDFIYNDNMIGSDDTFRHSKRLSFMRKRLNIARALLNEQGVIFISIDDNEQANLKILCDEIFGESNFITMFLRKTKSMTGDDGNGLNIQHEYLLVYGKKKCLVNFAGALKDFKGYSNPDNDPNGIRCSGDPSAKSGSQTTYFGIKNPITGQIDYPPKGRYWAFSEDTLKKYIDSGRIKFKNQIKKGQRGFVFKRYASTMANKNEAVGTLEFIDNAFMNSVATVELKEIFNERKFDYPKPTTFVKQLIKIFPKKDGIILDFFAGSGTTGQAVLELNKEDGGNRHFILCTNNENNICDDITYERLKTVITGKRQDGSIYRENPYEDNLTYLKVNFAEKEDDIDFYKICEQLIALKSSVENRTSFIFDNDDKFYDFLKSSVRLDDCVVYLLDDILLPSGSNLKERKIEIRELPKYFYSEEELINNDTI